MSFSYVILHYKNIKDTVKCIESLLETAGRDSKLIVVDNGSNDNSGIELKDKYSGSEQVEVLLLPENLGFSKGNNAGYQYAKCNLKSDYIVVTNNDVVFYQLNFEDSVKKIYKETNFDILGPDVYIPRHKDHQSPLFKVPVDIVKLKKEIEEYKFYQQNPDKFEKRLRLHATKNMLCSKSKIINFVYNKLRGKDVLDYKKRYENVGLQGSCLIFSKQFIDCEDKAFDPEPFLYEEESFLFYRCSNKGYKMVYDPSVAIRHEEAASFINANKNNRERLEFMLKHHVKAREMLLNYLMEKEQEK